MGFGLLFASTPAFEPLFGMAVVACCLLAIVLLLVLFIIAFVFKLLIEFLPATIAAVAVYLFTGDIILAGISFVVVALIMIVARRDKRRERY